MEWVCLSPEPQYGIAWAEEEGVRFEFETYMIKEHRDAAYAKAKKTGELLISEPWRSSHKLIKPIFLSKVDFHKPIKVKGEINL